MGNPVVHFEVVGRDAEALQSFYKEAFDWQMEVQPGPPPYAMAYPGAERGINGGVGAGPGGGAGHVPFYVEGAGPEAVLGKIEDLGGTTVMGPPEGPGGTRIATVDRKSGAMGKSVDIAGGRL